MKKKLIRSKAINVVAAIIRKENHFLIVQRNRKKHLGLKWEFPGGKVEFNESFEEALAREIKEELNIKIDIYVNIAKIKYRDKKVNINLYYYLCNTGAEKICLNEHEDIAWVEKKNFFKYDFVEGDMKVFSLL